jgi:hypothetical protein
MWTAIKVFFSGALKKVLAALIPWLKTEAAKFAAEYLEDAKDIVAGVAKQTDLSNSEKFAAAKIRLIELMRDKAAAYKESWVNLLVELAYSEVKQLEKPK